VTSRKAAVAREPTFGEAPEDVGQRVVDREGAVIERTRRGRDAQVVADVDADQHEVGRESERALLENDQIVVDVLGRCRKL